MFLPAGQFDLISFRSDEIPLFNKYGQDSVVKSIE